MYVKNVRDLKIYQIALELAGEINKLVKQIPHYWNIEECGQIFRSSSSSPANIAEGFGQRFYEKKFIFYLRIAMGSSDESQDHLEKLKVNGHLEDKIADEYISRYISLSVKILNMINYFRRRKK